MVFFIYGWKLSTYLLLETCTCIFFGKHREICFFLKQLSKENISIMEKFKLLFGCQKKRLWKRKK